MPEIKLLCDGRTACFDDTTWPTAGEANGDLEYALIYGDAPTRSQVLAAVSVMGAYRYLVWLPKRRRDAVIRRLREAERQYQAAKPKEGGG